MLRNHGLLTVGRSIPDGFLAMYLFQSACAVQVRAQAGRGALVSIDEKILAGAQAQAAQVTSSLGGELAWPGLLRKLGRLDPGYKA